MEETADGITELVYRGLVATAPAEPIAETAMRLQVVADRLEALVARDSMSERER